MFRCYNDIWDKTAFIIDPFANERLLKRKSLVMSKMNAHFEINVRAIDVKWSIWGVRKALTLILKWKKMNSEMQDGDN